MNHFHLEQTAAYNRQRIEAELKQMRLEKLAREGQTRQNNLLRPILTGIGNWLLALGRRPQKKSLTPQVELNLKNPAC